MRVLVTTCGLGSHLNPMVPLGWALRAAGHEVMVASHPAMAGTITDAGLPALPAGPDVDMRAALGDVLARYRDRPPEAVVRDDASTAGTTTRHRDRSGSDAGLAVCRVAVWSAEQMIDDILAHCAAWPPDLVVFEPFSFAGPLVAAALGVPAVRHLWTVDSAAPLRRIEHVLMGDLAARYGLDGVRLLGDLTLDPCPPSLEVDDDVERVPMRYVPYNGPAVIPEWLWARPPHRPRVVVTAGNTLEELGLRRLMMAPQAVRGLAELDVEVVVAVRESQRELFEPLGDNVIHVGPVPLDPLLPGCAALVQQGGSGSTMTAALHGVPQVLTPSLPDQTLTAEKLAATGASRTYTGQEAERDGDLDVVAGRLREHVRAVLEPEYAGAAATLAAQMRALPTPARIVRLLEDTVARGTGTPAGPAPGR